MSTRFMFDANLKIQFQKVNEKIFKKSTYDDQLPLMKVFKNQNKETIMLIHLLYV